MKTNLKEISGKLTFEELTKVKFCINVVVDTQSAIKYYQSGYMVGYYNTDNTLNEEVLIYSIQTIKEVNKLGYELFVKKHYI
jgi:hypothetical protein